MNIAFFGSSLVSSYWNGAATYYRGIIHALRQRGHRTTFYEPDAYQRQQHRDIDDPDWARVVVYAPTLDEVRWAIADARHADLIVKASGVGVFDELLESELLELKKSFNLIVFWDVDAPATLDRVIHSDGDPFRKLIPRFDAILTYGGGEPVIQAYRMLGARSCVPIYNAVDPVSHHPVEPQEQFASTLGFLGNRLPDREVRVDEFFFKPAAALPRMQFLLGGAGWEDKKKSSNVRYIGHVPTRDHNAFNVTPRVVLNVSRESMARYGFSPATRVFEAAGAGACLISDAWEGIEMFLDPDTEVLVANNGNDVANLLSSLTATEAKAIGRAAYCRVLADHTYEQRAAQLESVLDLTACDSYQAAL
jgi:spore maturation protein CgeB